MFDLTIVISSYNREDKVAKTVWSIYESDLSVFKGIELLIIDDGSPRPVEKLVPQFGQVPTNVSVRILKQANAGIGATRNRGFREATSALVLFIDDDIILYKESIRKVYEAIKERAVPVLFGSYPFITHQSPALEKFAKHLYDYNSITETPAFRKVDGITSGLLCVNKIKLGLQHSFYKDDLSVPAAEEHELIARFHREHIPIVHAQHCTAIHNHHLELDWLVQQQYKYGLGTAEALTKYPEIMEMDRYRSLKQTMETEKSGKSWMKNLMASKAGRGILFLCARLLNRISPNKNHNSFFGKLISAYYRAGYRDGLKKFNKKLDHA